MKRKPLKYITGMLVILGVVTVQAQEGVSSSGGEAFGNGGSVSYSYGQVVYNTHTGASGSLIQGVQQPFEISINTGIDEVDIHLFCEVYPNPTQALLSLEISDFQAAELSYQLFNISGSLLENEKISSSVTNIDMSTLAPSSYILKVLDKQKEIITFKIIKN